MFGDIGTSIVRTIVPIIAGAIITFFTSKGFTFDDSFALNLYMVLQAIVTGVYYICVRVLEARFPQIGLLLGSTRKPEYTEGQ